MRWSMQHIKEWENALVIYVMSENPIFTYMTNYIARTWNNVATLVLYFRDVGWYIVNFF